MNKFKIIFLVLLISFCAPTYAQQALVATSRNYANSTTQFNYSIGQLFYTSTFSQQGSLNNGIEQAFENRFITNSIESSDDILQLFLFPNPTQSNISLNLQQKNLSSFEIKLCSLEGLTLYKTSIENNNATNIELEVYPSGIYVLYVYSGNKFLKLFKIIKL